ncbi:MAG: tetratricopeptide repeat protein [Candidatus Hermodarchaeota archaeon]
MKDKFYSKINEYRDPTKIIEDLYDKTKDLDFSDLEKKIKQINREKRRKEKVQESYIMTLDYNTKFPFKIKPKLPKLEPKNRKKLLKLEKKKDLMRGPICGHSVSSVSAKFCKRCGQKLIVFRGIDDYDEIIKLLKTSLKKNLEDYYSWADLASLYYNKGNYQKATKAYKNYLIVNPDELIIHIYLGITLNKLGKYSKALKAFRNAFQIDPNNSVVKSYEGITYALIENKEKATKSCLEAIKINSNDKLTWGNIAHVYNIIGDYELALEASNRALGCDPSFAHFWNNLGFAYYNRGEFNDAFESIYKSIKYAPYYSDAWRNLGLLYYSLGQYKFALKALYYSIELEPKDFNTWYIIAKVYFIEEDYDESLEAIIICLKLKKENKEAVKLCRTILDVEKFRSSNYYAWYFLAKLYYKQKNFEKSSEACTNSLNIKNDYKKAIKLIKNLENHL